MLRLNIQQINGDLVIFADENEILCHWYLIIF